MDLTPIQNQLSTIFRIGEVRLAETIGVGIEVLILALLTIFSARWAKDRIQRSARPGPAWAEVASLVGQGAAFLIYGVGFAIILSLVGLNPTAIAAILGAATFGSSLALQDVAKGFVNGAYLLLERPYRIGDEIRVGTDRGRVEEMGIRLTRLRTDGGERISVPSTVLFTSSFENATTGNVSRSRFLMTGIERPILEIEDAVVEALTATPHLAPRRPLVELLSAGPEGASATVTVVQDLGHRIDAQVISRLHSAFPEATVSTNLPGPTS